MRHLPLHGVAGQQVGGIASDWHRQSLWATGASATTAASAQQSCCDSSADTSCMPGHEAAKVLRSSTRPTFAVTVSSPCDRTSQPSPFTQTHAVPTPHAAVYLMQRPESSSPGAATRPQWRLAAWRQPHRPALLVPAVAALSRLRRPWRPLLCSGDGQQLPSCCKPAHPFTHRKCCNMVNHLRMSKRLVRHGKHLTTQHNTLKDGPQQIVGQPARHISVSSQRSVSKSKSYCSILQCRGHAAMSGG